MITVLVVEDTPSERELICDYLRQGGYNVVSAVNGGEGLEKFAKTQPNVVVTDLVMPGMSGLELCRAIKKTATTKVPVIACTSKNQELDRLWGMKQGIDVYLTKPFTKDDILQAVRSLNVGG
ncbi:response regulator [Pseudanabaena sp. FACHB-1998]|uniref:response regulator transcription factor n=1 Tax=Pseudanabaena sp. FACHB-1998 TaxID=2692858 RepID=UPI001680C081|nr:response regulator [Pseudanabaena sp. FACHB-1998]MBD2176395.1 response regulator [Pseudanabaena sp. FACHB-1998]